MKRLSRDTWIGIGLLFLLGVVTAVSLLQETRNNSVAPPLASFSAKPDGTLAFALWLEEIGFITSDDLAPLFSIPPATDLMIIFEPTTLIPATEWDKIDEWVEEGGILLIAGNEYGSLQAFRHYEFTLRFHNELNPAITVETPFLDSPIIADPSQLNGRSYFTTNRTDYVPLVGTNGRPAIITFPQGDGKVMLSGLKRPFTNIGLHEEAAPELVINLLNSLGQVETVWFDEWHHGLRPVEMAIDNSNWLQRTPIGRALLFSALVIFVTLLLGGRSFGRPVPLPKEIVRRAPLEYITAIANLSRRAGHRTAVLRDNHDRLKKHLGHRYRLTPALPDVEFVQKIAYYNPAIDLEALQTLLNQLSQKNVSESDMVRLAAETAKWLRK